MSTQRISWKFAIYVVIYGAFYIGSFHWLYQNTLQCIIRDDIDSLTILVLLLFVVYYFSVMLAFGSTEDEHVKSITEQWRLSCELYPKYSGDVLHGIMMRRDRTE
eukprot:80741_1